MFFLYSSVNKVEKSLKAMNIEKSEVKAVFSNQDGPHTNLQELVLKYIQTKYLRPIAEHTQKAFELANEFVKSRNSPIILDSGCGTGRSTQVLASKHPNLTIIGVDKSEVRLSRSGLPQKNAMYVRAELLDFWRLALQEKWPIQYHALYYPNPWPKESEAGRRFHLHPIFPTLLSLAPYTELRTNWEIYAEEFSMAACLASEKMDLHLSIEKHNFQPNIPETAFEEKYAKAGQILWKVICKTKNTSVF